MNDDHDSQLVKYGHLAARTFCGFAIVYIIVRLLAGGGVFAGIPWIDRLAGP